MTIRTNINIPNRRQERVRSLFIKIHNDLFKIDQHIFHTENELNLVEEYVITLEDRRFFYHNGFDIRSILRELLKIINIKIFFKLKGGASTIDMQFVRTITGYKKKTFSRKTYEIFLAYIINHRYSKRDILYSYMHHAYLGTRLTGIEQAAKKTYNKKVSELSGFESAMVASMLLSPQPLVQTARWYIRAKRRATYAMRLRKTIE
ncbi:transglycosylase domain-containing protein [Yersinia ruckeri]|uniref:biosynthetic peptidoglycan transglycosylase n=2 Tax=Yersinia ruckeri TaxID=29486 RepID=UPI0032059F23